MQWWNSRPWVHFSGCETNWGRRKGVEVMTETKSYGNDSLKPISFYYFWLAVCIHVKTVYAQVNPDMKWFVCVDTRRRSFILSRSMLRVLMMLVRYVFLPGLIHSYHKIFVWTYDHIWLFDVHSSIPHSVALLAVPLRNNPPWLFSVRNYFYFNCLSVFDHLIIGENTPMLEY